MMRTSFILTLILLASWEIKAQDSYAVSNIPDSLLQNAQVVIRKHIVDFEVIRTNHTTTRITKALTILNEEAKDEAHVVLHYDKLNTIKWFGIILYDRNGKKIRRIKEADIKDYSATSGADFYDDSRVKVAEIEHHDYPFTVEYTLEKKSKQSLFYPSVFFLPGEKYALQQANVRMTTPSDLPLRYKLVNLQTETNAYEHKGKNIYEWQVTNLTAIQNEPYGPNPTEVLPYLLTGPVKFEMEGHQGKMDSWKNFGQWINSLNYQRDDLPEELIQKIHSLTADLPTKKEKVAAIYRYLQQNTRYISIQLGIGGFQPFEASFVAEKGYGDCKALTNFTKAMLKSAGINSYYTLVNAGPKAREVQEDFPFSQFNHVFLCVPDDQDTLWLECTSQTNPFGYLGTFTSDRKVLFIDEQGGQMIHTPSYSPEQSSQVRTAEVNILSSGDAQIHTTTQYSGLQYDNIRRLLLSNSQEDQKETLYKRLDLPAVKIIDFELVEQKKPLPEAQLKMNLEVRNLASITGNRLFLTPNIFNRSTSVPKFMSGRTTDVVLDFPYQDTDTIKITVPEGYQVESLPSSKELESPFGNYNLEIKVEGNRVTYIRTVRTPKGRFPAKSYAKFRKFRKRMRMYDKYEIVYIKKESKTAPSVNAQ